jgi:alanyl-tRNA synthetase
MGGRIFFGRKRPVTEKIYYSDQYRKEFSATVTEVRPLAGDFWGIVLDRTAFYPEGGGQPCDTGWLDGIPVSAVYEDNGAVVHVAAERPVGQTVNGRLDWGRRFDHMQQHSGEHIVSGVFGDSFGAENVGFHLGADRVYIDVTLAELTDEQAAAAEQAANEAVFANLPIKCELVDFGDLAKFTLRKQPGKEFVNIRLVSIKDVDCCPCGGTHVAASGEIGLIKIRGWERKAGITRVDFVCGGRALADYRLCSAVCRELSTRLSVPVEEVSAAFARQMSKSESLHRQLQSARSELNRHLAARLYEEAVDLSGLRLAVSIVSDATPGELSDLAKQVLARGRAIVLLATGSAEANKSHLLFACTPGAPADMGGLLKKALQATGGKGGGNAYWAQGGGSWCDSLADALELARRSVSG